MVRYLTIKQMLDELKEKNFNKKIVSNELGVSENAVLMWYKENRCNSKNREKLKELHRQIVGEGTEENKGIKLSDEQLEALLLLKDLGRGWARLCIRDYGKAKSWLEYARKDYSSNESITLMIDNVLSHMNEHNWSLAAYNLSTLQSTIINDFFSDELEEGE